VSGGTVDRRLLDAVVAVADGLELEPTLRRIVRAARDLTRARYAALGVLGEDGLHKEFVYIGIDEQTARVIGHLPRGLGVLGHITRVGRAVRVGELSAHPASTGFPPGHPPMHSFLGVPVGIGDRVIGNLYLAEKQAGPGEGPPHGPGTPQAFTAEDEDVVVALAAAAAVAVENAGLYEDVQRQARWMAAAQQVATTMLSGEEDAALYLIARRAGQVSDAAAAALLLPGRDGQLVLEIAVGDGVLPDLIGTVMPVEGRAVSVLDSGQGLRVPELASDPKVMVQQLRAYGPALYAPLIAGEEHIGVLMLLRAIGANEFTVTDLVTAQTFARQAALALQLAEGRHRAEQAELLEERARIARDLHDLVVQELFAMGMRLSRLRDQVKPEELAVLDSSLESLDRAVRQIRVTVGALRDPEEPTSLVDRLHAETSRAQAFLGFRPQLDVSVDDGLEVDDEVAGDIADDLIAVVREGLANAARHARASEVAVRVQVVPGTASVQVRDDGTGLPAVPARRSGLDNLAERAHRHGGDCEVGPATDGGTVLHWQVPLVT
jgi:signal transduction histidine kinase